MILRLSFQTRCSARKKRSRTVSVRSICDFHRLNAKAGFSLLEVILALGILFGAIAILGELARLGMHNAKLTKDLTRAQMLCKSKMAEITTGITPLDPVQRAKFDDLDQNNSDVPWIYTIETETIDQEGLIAVRVTVQKDLPAQLRPVSFSLVQWMTDPSITQSSNSAQQTGTSTSATETTNAQ